jgi:hypothetical protein
MKQVLFILLLFISFQGFSQTKIESFTIGNIKIMKTDLGEMNWFDAKKACEDLGDGWRLPTIKELEYINKSKSFKILKLKQSYHDYYWSSTEVDDGKYNAWMFRFYIGAAYDSFDKKNMAFVRAVRDLK